MSQSASGRGTSRGRAAAIAVAVLLVAGVVAVAVWRLGGDDGRAEPLATTTERTEATATPSPEASTSSPTPTPTPTPSPSASCEGPDTLYNEDGVEQDSLLPDCGVAPVTKPQEQESGLSLACGGSYPVILYKTTTRAGSRTSICGTDSSGADFRFVTQAEGGQVKDLDGSYESQLDAFVAKDGSTTYTVQAYDGTLLVDRDGKRTKQTSDDWVSLDNEPDSD